MRTSLTKITNPVKKIKKLEGNGDRKGSIRDLISRFDTGGDGKGPLDRPKNDENESSEKKRIIELGLDKQ